MAELSPELIAFLNQACCSTETPATDKYLENAEAVGGNLVLTMSNGTVFTVPISSSAEETLTTLDSVAINGSNLEIKYTGEDGVQTTKSVDITSLTNVPETVTELKTFSIAGSVITLEYVDEEGTTTTKTVTLPGGSGGGSTVAIADVLSAGKKIAKITIDGTDTIVNETITELKTFSIANNILTIEYIDEAGITTTKTATLNNQSVTANNNGNLDVTVTPTTTAGVTNFTVRADLPLATTTPAGLQNGLTIDSSGNFYADAPESSVVRMSIPPGTQQSAPSTTTQLVVDVTTAAQVGNTDVLVPNVTLNAVKMLAGYDYEFSAQLSAEFGAAANSLTFQFQITTDVTGATGWTNRQLVGVIRPLSSTSLIYQNIVPQGIWSPTTDSLIRLVCTGSSGNGNLINNPSAAGMTGISWVIKMVGKNYN